jgi:hypothetical protein
MNYLSIIDYNDTIYFYSLINNEPKSYVLENSKNQLEKKLSNIASIYSLYFKQTKTKNIDITFVTSKLMLEQFEFPSMSKSSLLKSMESQLVYLYKDYAEQFLWTISANANKGKLNTNVLFIDKNWYRNIITFCKELKIKTKISFLPFSLLNAHLTLNPTHTDGIISYIQDKGVVNVLFENGKYVTHQFLKFGIRDIDFSLNDVELAKAIIGISDSINKLIGSAINIKQLYLYVDGEYTDKFLTILKHNVLIDDVVLKTDKIVEIENNKKNDFELPQQV